MTGYLITKSQASPAQLSTVVKLSKKSPGVWTVGYRCEMLGFTESTTFEARTTALAQKRAVPLLAELLERSANRFRLRSDEALRRMQALISEAALLRKMPERAPWSKKT